MVVHYFVGFRRHLQVSRDTESYLRTGRFSFKSWATGEMIVPETALPFLAHEGISFVVEGPATYEQLIPSVRNPPASAV